MYKLSMQFFYLIIFPVVRSDQNIWLTIFFRCSMYIFDETLKVCARIMSITIQFSWELCHNLITAVRGHK